MDRPLSAVVRVAATPDQAKVFVALLQADGIPAYVEGDMLADEVAASRRLMNLAGTRVLVPSASLERAREILGNTEVDPAELEQQALAAADAEHLPEPPPTVAVARASRWPLVIAIAAALVFLCLWLSQLEANAAERDPRFVYERIDSGMEERRSSDRRLLRAFTDWNKNGLYECVTVYRADGSMAAMWGDPDEDGMFEALSEYREDGTRTFWADTDRDGVYDECRTTDRDDRVLQWLVWQPGTGFVPKKP